MADFLYFAALWKFVNVEMKWNELVLLYQPLRFEPSGEILNVKPLRKPLTFDLPHEDPSEHTNLLGRVLKSTRAETLLFFWAEMTLGIMWFY